MKIPQDSWNIIEKVIRRYPENNQRKSEIYDEVTTTTPRGDLMSMYQDPNKEVQRYTSPTERAAIRLTSEYIERLDREIKAVKAAYEKLSVEQRSVIAARYWHNTKKNTPYLKIRDIPYSERQMKRICRKMVYYTGKGLGEIL